jgi:hypothetical protein
MDMAYASRYLGLHSHMVHLCTHIQVGTVLCFRKPTPDPQTKGAFQLPPCLETSLCSSRVRYRMAHEMVQYFISIHYSTMQ